MKLDIVPESPREWLALAAGAVPQPLVHTMVGILLSRTILAAVRLGVFEALSDHPRNAEQVSADCHLHLDATKTLLRALTGIGYIRVEAEGYALSPFTRKWLATDSKLNLKDAILHRYLDLRLMDHAEEYVRSGNPLDFHDHLSPDDWKVYVNGQRAQTAMAVDEIVDRTPVPEDARDLLDIGGAHGLFADGMCRKYPKLNAVVFDLPEALNAVDQSSVSERVQFRAGDILTDDPGTESYDLIAVSNLSHHFTDDQNQQVIKTVARALRPNGLCVIADFVLSSSSSKTDQIPALLDFYFSVTSGGGALSLESTSDWMKLGGLSRIRTRRLRKVPGMALIIGQKHAG